MQRAFRSLTIRVSNLRKNLRWFSYKTKDFGRNLNTKIAPWSLQGTERHGSHKLPCNSLWHLHWALQLVKLFTPLVYCDPLYYPMNYMGPHRQSSEKQCKQPQMMQLVSGRSFWHQAWCSFHCIPAASLLVQRIEQAPESKSPALTYLLSPPHMAYL